MARRLPLLLLLVGAVLGIVVWFYRAQQRTEAGPPPAGSDLVRQAWVEGRDVALRGSQQIKMQDPDGGGIVTVNAEVLHSGDGRIRIDYLSNRLEGVKVWENGDRTYRFNPKRKRLSVALKRGTPDEQAQAELRLLE